jgi:hypothetical protein
LVLNSPEFDVQRGAYMIENLIGFQRAFLPFSYTEEQFRDQIKPVIVRFD